MSSFDSKGVGDGLGGKDVDAEMKRQSKAGSFGSLGLDKDLLSGLNRMGYKAPTPVQRKALPIALAGMDMVCMARTGSGKTCVFLVPLIQLVKKHDGTAGVRAVVLSPTRELALQTYRFAKDMAKFTDIRIASIIGGDPLEGQFEALAGRPDVLIATPGRLMHHLQEISTFKLKSVKYLVFDEADRLFEMGVSTPFSFSSGSAEGTLSRRNTNNPISSHAVATVRRAAVNDHKGMPTGAPDAALLGNHAEAASSVFPRGPA